MHLTAYLKKSGLSQGDFGQRLHPIASQGLVSQWIRGKTRITLDYALQIAKATDDEVTPQDCSEMFTAPDAHHETLEPDRVPS